MNTSLDPRRHFRVSVLRLAIACPVLFLLTGCISASASKSFDSVANQTDVRIGKRVQWNSGSDADAHIQTQIDEALASELTADKAVQIALLNNRRLQAVYEDLGVSQAELVEAGLLRNPLFEGTYQSGLDGAPGPQIEATLLFGFLDLLFIPLKRSIAQANLAAAQWEATGAVLDLAGEVQQQFIVVQSDMQTIGLLRQVVESTSASTDLAERLHAVGNIRDLDLENEHALHARTRLDLAQAEAESLKNRERLVVLMGIWGTSVDQLRIAERLPDPPSDELSSHSLEQSAIEANIDLEFNRGLLNAAASRARLTNFTAILPDLEAGGAWTREASGEELAGGAISLPIPLFNWGQGRRAAARAELRRASGLHYAKAVEVRSAARVALAQLHAARDRALFSRNVMVPLNERRLKNTQLEYNAMQIGAFELLAAKNETILSGKQYIEDLRDYWLARADVDLLLAGRIGGNLSTDISAKQSTAEDNSMDNRKGH